jgi:6-phosphogluconolactonase (cycloisomerase 2 family)
MRTPFPVILCGLISTLTACGGGNSAPPSYTVGGTLSGIAGSGLTLQLNGEAMLALAGNGAFVFPTRVAAGATYDLTIATQPVNPSQTCVATPASGVIGNSNITNVSVICTTNTYTVGGAVNGLSGTGLILQNNASDDLTVNANGSFGFTTHAVSGSAYSVTVKSQPANPSQTCSVTNPSGTLDGSDVTSVVVECTTNSFSVGGTVSGLVGTGLILELNGGGDLPAANGSFTFTGTSLSGTTYAVTVKAQPTAPSQTCAVTSMPGTIGAAAVTNVSVICTTNAYTVGGAITGLSGSDLVLQVNGSQDLMVGVNGSFVFPTSLASGTTYTVTIKTQPVMRHEICIVTNASGTIVATKVSNVSVDCSVVVGFIYTLDPDKRLAVFGMSQSTGAPIPSGSPASAGSNPTSFIAAPSGNFLYVASSTANTISIYAVDPNQGGLTAVGLPVASGSNPTSMVFATSGAYLFVSNSGDSTMSTYTVDATTGSLTPAGSALPLASGTQYRLAVTPDGKILYVLSWLPGINNGAPTVIVTAYAIDAGTGGLTAGPAIQPSVNSRVMTVDPLGRFLYLDNDLSTSLDSTATVLPYAIDSNTGALTAIGSGTSVGSSASGYSNGWSIAAEPSGRYLYIISNYNFRSADDNIIALAVDQTTGALSQIGSPVSIGSDPLGVICDPSGQFVYVSNGSIAGATGTTWSDITSFIIGGVGAPPGELSPSGQGTQFPQSTVQFNIGDTTAIVE